jgi:hypothetical protein
MKNVSTLCVLLILIIIKVLNVKENKFRHKTGYKDPEEERRYCSTLSLTSALYWGGWLTPSPARFTPGRETHLPICRRLDGPRGRCGLMRRISPPPGLGFRTFQPVASRYIDYTKLDWLTCGKKIVYAESGGTC